MRFHEFEMPEYPDANLAPQVNDILHLHSSAILLERRINQESYARSLEVLEYSRVFAAIGHDDEVMGMTCYESVPSERKAWIGAVAVMPHLRGNNVGRFMLGNLVQTALADNHDTLALMSFTESMPFYSRLGFVTVDGSLRMRLDLTDTRTLKRTGLLEEQLA